MFRYTNRMDELEYERFKLDELFKDYQTLQTKIHFQRNDFP